MQLCLLIPKLHLFSEVRWVRDEGRALSKEIQVLQEMTVATCTPSTSPRRPGMNEGGLPQCDLVTTSRTAQAKHHRWNSPCVVQHFPSFTLLRDRLLPRAQSLVHLIHDVSPQVQAEGQEYLKWFNLSVSPYHLLFLRGHHATHKTCTPCLTQLSENHL